MYSANSGSRSECSLEYVAATFFSQDQGASAPHPVEGRDFVEIICFHFEELRQVMQKNKIYSYSLLLLSISICYYESFEVLGKLRISDIRQNGQKVMETMHTPQCV